MRIGVYAPMGRSSGGVYQYGVSIITALDGLRARDPRDEFVLLTDEIGAPVVRWLAARGWKVVRLRPPFLQRLLTSVRERLTTVVGWLGGVRVLTSIRTVYLRLRPGRRRRAVTDGWVVKGGAPPAIRDLSLDLVIYTLPSERALELGIPYVMAIHDLQHRLQPEFPEVSADGEWESRDRLFRAAAPAATLLLADSEVGREDILSFYGPEGVGVDQVKVLPFVPAAYLADDVPALERVSVRDRYRLPTRYLFYPAQFWPHKNHLRIVEAVGLLAGKSTDQVSVVFAGSRAGGIREQTFRSVVSRARDLGVSERVRYLGYVPDEDMSALYAEAEALIMPTFFGPTNIPVLEAWSFGCPVITSDIRGIREQVGDAALVVDPRSEEQIARAIERIWTDERLRVDLAGRGRERLRTYTPDDFRDRLHGIVEEAKARLRARPQPEHHQRTETA